MEEDRWNPGGTGIFNGDIGVITEIDLNAELLTVVFDDRQAEYDFDMLRELELAYAMTVHKSQGSEYQAVVLAAWSCAPNPRTRRVPLYGHNPGEKAPCGGGGQGGHPPDHDGKPAPEPPVQRPEAATAGEGAMRALYRLLDLLFPPKCVLCGRLLDREETDLCGACRREGPVFSRRRNVHSLCDRLDGCLPL